MSLQWTSSRHSAPYLGTLTPRVTVRPSRVKVTHRTQTPSIPVKTSINSERDAYAQVRTSRTQHLNNSESNAYAHVRTSRTQHLNSERRLQSSERDRETRACSCVKQRCSNCPKGLILSFEMRSVIVNLHSCQNHQYLVFEAYQHFFVDCHLHQKPYVHLIL